MTDERFQKVKRLFNQVAGLAPEERSKQLDVACADDDELRANVEKLLAGHDSGDTFVHSAVAEAASHALDAPGQSSVGRVFGAWRLVSLIDRGGMGAVYLAERADGAFEQQAAVKLISAATMSPVALQRFNDERQILARLEHPYIARLIDGGTTEEGEPWLAMEYVNGVRIDEYCDSLGLGIPARLSLFKKVAAGIDYAHRNLVVHRDIKPSNILVTPDGEPKVLDFGVARLFANDGGAVATVTEYRALTPIYASPEALKGEPLTIATDVYSLSVMLYELLVGATPFAAMADDATALHVAICEGDREAPSVAVSRSANSAQRVRELSGDLDNIVLKGLRPEIERRYGSVRELVEDIDRHLRDQPVLARPDTLKYRTAKFLKRRRGPVVTGVAAVAVIAVSSTLFINRIITERNNAEAAQARAEQVTIFLTDLFTAPDRHASAGRDITVNDVLDEGAERIRTELADQPLERARLMQLIAETYNGLSLNAKAAELSAEAYAIRRELLGELHVDTLASKRGVANYGRLKGDDVDAAIATLEEVLAAQIEVAGADSEEVAATHDALGGTLRYRGDQLAALVHYEAAMEILSGLEAGHPHRQFRVNVLNQIGNIQSSLGEPESAIATYQQTLDMLEERGETEHPLVGSLHSNIGGAYSKLGQYDKALGYLETAVEHTRRILGEQNEDYEVQLSTLGRTLTRLRRFDEAESALDKARGVAEGLYGEDHPYYAWHLVNLARMRQLQDNHAAARELLDEAIPVYREAYGDYHPFLAAAEIGYAESATETGDVALAARQARETLERMRGYEDHERHIEALGRSVLGRALGLLGEDEEARVLMRDGLASLREMFGDEHQLVVQAAGYFVAFLEQRDEPVAEEYRVLLAGP